MSINNPWLLLVNNEQRILLKVQAKFKGNMSRSQFINAWLKTDQTRLSQSKIGFKLGPWYTATDKLYLYFTRKYKLGLKSTYIFEVRNTWGTVAFWSDTQTCLYNMQLFFHWLPIMLNKHIFCKQNACGKDNTWCRLCCKTSVSIRHS